MKTTLAEKPGISVVTDPTEIASIKRGSWHDIVGWSAGGDCWYAYDWSLQRYREKRRLVKTRRGCGQRMLSWVRRLAKTEEGK